MEQHQPEENTIIRRILCGGEKKVFSSEEMPSRVGLSLGGRLGTPEAAELSIYDVSKLPKAEDGGHVYGEHKISSDCKFAVISDCHFDSNAGTGIEYIRPGEQVDIGRTSENFPELRDNLYVSRRHVSIFADKEGNLTITDTSTNNTVVTYENMSRRKESEWDILDNYNPSRDFSEQETEERTRQLHYEAIFSAPTPKGRDRFGNDLDKRLKITEESLSDAALAYRFSDSEIKKIIDKYKTDEIWREEDVNSLVRTNNELRIELGKCLLARLGEDSHLPYRVMIDEQKNINYIGYPQVSSREASALLALAMLDGTFKRPKHDPIVIRYGDVELGQHRWAALRALGLDREGDVYIKRVLTIENIV